MKILALSLLLLGNITCFGQLSSNNTYLIVESIYKIEGGSKTKYPYGVMSVKTSNPRQICINTVNNHYKRWISWGKTNNFFDSLADRYCPPSADKVGNANWKKNIHRMLDGRVNIQ